MSRLLPQPLRNQLLISGLTYLPVTTYPPIRSHLKQKSYRPTPRFLLHCATKRSTQKSPLLDLDEIHLRFLNGNYWHANCSAV